MKNEIEMIQTCTDRAIECLKRRDRKGAEYHLLKAAEFAAEIEDPQTRRNQYSSIGLLMVELQFPNLAIMAVKEALALDYELDDLRSTIKDIITYGSSLHLLMRHKEAAEQFRQALDLALRTKDYPNAASASSNLAAALAAEGQLMEAKELLNKSLEYLNHEPYPDTEFKTRVMLVQLMDALKEPPEACFKAVRDLLVRFREDMTPRYKGMLRQALEAPLNRFFAGRRELDPRIWVPANFPELMESGDEG